MQGKASSRGLCRGCIRGAGGLGMSLRILRLKGLHGTRSRWEIIIRKRRLRRRRKRTPFSTMRDEALVRARCSNNKIGFSLFEYYFPDHTSSSVLPFPRAARICNERRRRTHSSQVKMVAFDRILDEVQRAVYRVEERGSELASSDEGANQRP